MAWKSCASCGATVEPSVHAQPHSQQDTPHAVPNGSEIFWENLGTGEIRGPATFHDYQILREGDHQEEWFLIEFQGMQYWVREMTLRSRQQWQCQKPIRTSAKPTERKPHGSSL
ncbi:MAG: hypothetical protein CV090_14830 [Nitrospira sp. WS238]|nr:hypothetical protein [Nitrospira sp. WS238]